MAIIHISDSEIIKKIVFTFKVNILSMVIKKKIKYSMSESETKTLVQSNI